MRAASNIKSDRHLSESQLEALDSTGGYSTLYGDGSATSFTIAHGLGSTSVDVFVHRLSDGRQALPQIDVISSNQISITHSIAPATDSMRVVISRVGV